MPECGAEREPAALAWVIETERLAPEILRDPVASALRYIAERVFEEKDAQQRPMRGDPVEAWIKRRRDEYSHLEDSWHALDALLDDYRLHADTGTPLSGAVQER